MYETVAAVISSKLLRRLRGVPGCIQRVADHFGAALITTNSKTNVVMGPQSVVDEVKAQLELVDALFICSY